MAAADSFVGAALSPSPYSEAVERLAHQEAALKFLAAEVERLKVMVHAKSIQFLDERIVAQRATRRIEALEKDNEWLRELLTNLSRNVRPPQIGGPR